MLDRPQNREIYLLNKAVKILQPEEGFRPGIESITLGAASPARSGDHVLDAGCGVGSAGICLKHRVPEIILTGIDIEQTYVDFARLNETESSFYCVSIQDYKSQFLFDHIICNPPFYEGGQHLRSPDSLKAVAHGHENSDISLETWIKNAHRLLKSKGSLTLIHRIERLDDIIILLQKKFGSLEIIPLWAKEGENAKRVIVRAYKDRYGPLKLCSGLVFHEPKGAYTKEACKILKDGEGLFL